METAPTAYVKGIDQVQGQSRFYSSALNIARNLIQLGADTHLRERIWYLWPSTVTRPETFAPALCLLSASSAMSLAFDSRFGLNESKWYCDRSGPREDRRWEAYSNEQCEQLNLAYKIDMPFCLLQTERGLVRIDFVDAFRETKGYESWQVQAPQGTRVLSPRLLAVDPDLSNISLVEPILAGKEDSDPFIKYKSDSIATVMAGGSTRFEREQAPHELLTSQFYLAHKGSSSVVQGNLDTLLSSGLTESDAALDEILKSVAQRSVEKPVAPASGAPTDYSKNHAFFGDLMSEPSNKSDSTVTAILPDKSFFRQLNLEPYTKHTELVTLENTTGEEVKWTVMDAASASHHHLFTCVSIQDISQAVNLSPSLEALINQGDPLPYPTQRFLKQTDRNFATSGTLAPNQVLSLTVSFVFLKPRRSGASHSFERVSRVQFGTGSGAKSTVFLGFSFTGSSTTKTHWNPTLRDISMGTALGKGAFGLVADCSVLGLNCAIKIWRNDTLAKSTINDFLVELNMTSSLYHDRIIPFIGAWSSDPSGISFLVMKKAPTSLRKHFSLLANVAAKHPSWSIFGDLRRRIGLAIAAAEGIEYLHSQSPPILHRDIKSDNMVMEDPMLYIIDFGFAGPQKTLNPTDKRYRFGTPGWSAPETKRGEYSTKSDVYSFGMLLYELSTLEPPKEGAFYTLPIGHALRDLFNVCTDSDPNKRPEISKVIEDLRLIYKHGHISPQN